MCNYIHTHTYTHTYIYIMYIYIYIDMIMYIVYESTYYVFFSFGSFEHHAVWDAEIVCPVLFVRGTV